jgi:cytochrome P450
MHSLIDEKSLADQDIQECPWAYYHAMHDKGFYFDEKLGMYMCASYPLMREILRNTQLFSSVNSQNISHMRTPPQEVRDLQGQMQRTVNILVSSDPPDHGRIREMLDAPFRRREIEKLRPKIVEIIGHTIDRFIERGAFEAVEEFAIPIPVTVIADILGLSRSMAGAIKDWSDASVEPLGMMITDERWIACTKQIKAFQDYIAVELEERKSNPRDDLLTHLVQARDEQGNALTLPEMLGITSQILVAGNETTTNGIAAGIQMLIENPEQQRQLRDDPSRILTFVNEVLRLESPVQGLFRVVMEDTEIEGIKIAKGARIMLRFAAANRDAEKYDHPDDLDVCRKNAGTHVGFGAGIHHCLGANLAREEMLQAFTLLLKRLDNLAFKPGGNDFTHHPSMVLRGLGALHVTFTPR